MNKTKTFVVGAMVAAALLSACGDDKKSDGGSTDSAAFCAKLQEYKTASDGFDSSLDDPTPESLKTAFETMAGMLADLESSAPSEISADLGKLNDSIEMMLAGFEKYDWDFMAFVAAPEFQEIDTLMSSDDMTAAQDRLDAWALDTCKIDMGD